MIVTRYSYNVPQLSGLRGDETPPAGSSWVKLPVLLGGAVIVGLLGIAYIEYSQGWRPGRRRRRYV